MSREVWEQPFFEGLANVSFLRGYQPKDRGRGDSQPSSQWHERKNERRGGRGTRVISKENGGWLPEHYLMVTAKEGGKKDREIGALVTLRDRNVRVAIFDMTKVRISSRVGCLLPSGRREFYFLFFGKRAENPSNV